MARQLVVRGHDVQQPLRRQRRPGQPSLRRNAGRRRMDRGGSNPEHQRHLHQQHRQRRQRRGRRALGARPSLRLLHRAQPRVSGQHHRHRVRRRHLCRLLWQHRCARAAELHRVWQHRRHGCGGTRYRRWRGRGASAPHQHHRRRQHRWHRTRHRRLRRRRRGVLRRLHGCRVHRWCLPRRRQHLRRSRTSGRRRRAPDQ